MNTAKRLSATTALALTLGLGLAACSGDEPDVQPPANDPAATATTDDTTDDATGTTPDDTTGTSAPGGEATGDLTAIALTAIGTAETEAGGTAYEIDDQDDDGTWEVDVRVGDRSVEVTVSADGTQVEGTEEDDLDEDDRAGLDAATITLADAIELAVAEAGGVLDDAELEGEDDGQPHHWEVTVDTDGSDDVEVRVGVDGQILGTDG